MPESTQSRVSPEETRTGRDTPRGRTRRDRAAGTIGSPPVWDWDADGSQIKISRLNDRIGELEREIADLQAAAQRAAEQRLALRAGLRELAEAGWRERKRVRARLMARGLL